MFKSEYQGGAAVEVFSASGKDPHDKLKNHVKTKFDQTAKGNVYVLEGSTTLAKLHFPPTESKQFLGLIQRFFVLQVYVPLSKDFAVELGMTDINNSKRRLMISTSFKDLSSTPLHAKLPLIILKRDLWLNLCFDLRSFINDMFPNQTYKSLEEFQISGTCKIRRVFTMKRQPPDTSDFPDELHTEPLENIPINLQFSSNVNFITQVISVSKVRKYIALKDSRSETSGYWSSSSDDLTNMRKLSAREQTHTRIAFGTKVAVPAETPRSGRRRSGCNSARSERNHHNQSSETCQPSSNQRKAFSSKARLSSQPYEQAKENPGNRDRDLKLYENNQMTKPSNLISKVGDLDMSVSHDQLFHDVQTLNALGENESPSIVFEFVSRPHSLPRELPDNEHTTAFETSLSTSVPDRREARERIQEKINRITPTPRSGSASPKTLRSMRDVKNSSKSKPIRPPSSLSPDLSLSQSGHAYNSAKYSDGVQSSVEDPPVNKSIISVKSSDATLTESVDTLVQTSLRESNNDIMPESLAILDDSLSPPIASNQHLSRVSSVTVSHRDLKEVSPKPTLPESNHYPVGTWNDSFEAQMLESMKRSVEEDMKEPDEEDGETSDDVEYKVDFDDSFGVSWSTYQHPPPMNPQAYDFEMNEGFPESGNTINNCSLSKSNPRDWANLLSPPLVLPSHRAQQKKESVSDAESLTNEYDAMGLSDGSSSLTGSAGYKSSTTAADTDDEEMLDLLYDPCLNCYFDPKSGKYYELKN